MLLKITAKASYFVTRLVVFNERFEFLYKKSNQDLCVIWQWHEAIAGRCAENKASSFCPIIKKRILRLLILFSGPTIAAPRIINR